MLERVYFKLDNKNSLNFSFEGRDRRIKNINKILEKHNIKSLNHAKEICEVYKIYPEKIVKNIQTIAFDNACWAYILGCSIALQNKSKIKFVSDVSKFIGEGLQAFCVPGSVADTRKVGLGHGNLGAKLLEENTKCFAFIAGHESFAAAEGAIGIAKFANKSRKKPLKVILNGLGKDAAYIISRINGFTYVHTEYDFVNNKLNILSKKKFSNNINSEIYCYGANEPIEGLEILKYENVDISITGNSTNPVRFQHIVAGTYKKFCSENQYNYFSVASGGGTGRTLHPDNVSAGPASYGLTDSMGRMHSDAQFAGSSSVPAHVDMMGFIGMGNNPIVGATVACSVETYNKIKN